jgi:uncharacterized protein DUF664
MTWTAPEPPAAGDEPLTGPDRPILEAFLASHRRTLHNPEKQSARAALAVHADEVAAADAAVRELPFEHTFTHDGAAYSLRLVHVHLISEYARHNGHADLLREALDGQRGR